MDHLLSSCGQMSIVMSPAQTVNVRMSEMLVLKQWQSAHFLLFHLNRKVLRNSPKKQETWIFPQFGHGSTVQVPNPQSAFPCPTCIAVSATGRSFHCLSLHAPFPGSPPQLLLSANVKGFQVSRPGLKKFQAPAVAHPLVVLASD